MWQNDSFQITFDTMNDASAAKLSGISGYDLTDYEFGFALSPKGPQCFCYIAASPNKAIENKVTNSDIAIKRSGKNTMIYELAIPWSTLAPLKPESGKVFRLNFICLDSDKSGQTSLYCMGLSQGIWSGKKPEQFKTFVLMP
jgi:hypothetical protein